MLSWALSFLEFSSFLAVFVFGHCTIRQNIAVNKIVVMKCHVVNSVYSVQTDPQNVFTVCHFANGSCSIPYSTFLAPCALNFFRVAANFLSKFFSFKRTF